MAREVNKLGPQFVARVTEPGRYSDGQGLYLIVAPTGSKRWVFLFRWAGKLKEMGLGGMDGTMKVGLKEAREAAERARANLRAGTNPIDARRSQREVPTFGVLAEQLIADLKSGWRNAKHGDQWTNTLSTHAAKLWTRKVDEITTDDVVQVLRPIWTEKAETASRVRGRIERVLDAAKVKGYRDGQNPAAWRGHLALILPKRRALTRGHHKALPYAKLPAFVSQLRRRSGIAALALEWTILTAARTGETRGATWDEIDEASGIWTIPATRMKGARVHRVALSRAALDVLRRVRALELSSRYVFPGPRKAQLSNGGMERVLDRMKVEATIHGFRAVFSTWASEVGGFPRDLIEQALAHVVGNEVERAYSRGDQLERRRPLMEAWAGYALGAPATNVSPIRGAA